MLLECNSESNKKANMNHTESRFAKDFVLNKVYRNNCHSWCEQYNFIFHSTPQILSFCNISHLIHKF
uniref:Uncharacterized protein n=1 Tax=Anguilla anguilla TaxID=7936 RepID=A0A0E9VEQ6_ANGAN